MLDVRPAILANRAPMETVPLGSEFALQRLQFGDFELGQFGLTIRLPAAHAGPYGLDVGDDSDMRKSTSHKISPREAQVKGR